MAQLTPIAKGLSTVIILGVAGSLAWNLGLKGALCRRRRCSGALHASDRYCRGRGQSPAADTDQAQPTAATAKADAKNAALGTPGNPLKVSLVSFHGYAPALVADGNSLDTQPGSIYSKIGLNVRFVIQDDIPTLATIFESGAAQCAWRTSDFWAQEQPNLRNAGLNGKAVMIVDNTQGGDAVIASDPAVEAVEPPGRTLVALLQFTPSHGILIDALDNASLTARRRKVSRSSSSMPRKARPACAPRSSPGT